MSAVIFCLLFLVFLVLPAWLQCIAIMVVAVLLLPSLWASHGESVFQAITGIESTAALMILILTGPVMAFVIGVLLDRKFLNPMAVQVRPSRTFATLLPLLVCCVALERSSHIGVVIDWIQAIQTGDLVLNLLFITKIIGAAIAGVAAVVAVIFLAQGAIELLVHTLFRAASLRTPDTLLVLRPIALVLLLAIGFESAISYCIQLLRPHL